MKKALVTGSSKGIGKAITKQLLELGYSVLGVSRTKALFEDKNYTHFQIDLTNQKEVLEFCKKLKKEKEIFIVVNNAGFGRFEPHEELSFKVITDMVMLNLTTPLLITNATLRNLKQNGGYLFNITSIEAIKSSKFAGVYSSTKAGLKAFGDSLFEESRKSNLSVTNIIPDMTQSNFYDELRFNVTQNENEKLLAEDIAQAIKHILSLRKGAVVQNYTIRSLNFGISKN
jgi:short-subunit dehydrogenase